jgi:hypothetical protein
MSTNKLQALADKTLAPSRLSQPHTQAAGAFGCLTHCPAVCRRVLAAQGMVRVAGGLQLCQGSMGITDVKGGAGLQQHLHTGNAPTAEQQILAVCRVHHGVTEAGREAGVYSKHSNRWRVRTAPRAEQQGTACSERGPAAVLKGALLDPRNPPPAPLLLAGHHP